MKRFVGYIFLNKIFCRIYFFKIKYILGFISKRNVFVFTSQAGLLGAGSYALVAHAVVATVRPRRAVRAFEGRDVQAWGRGTWRE